MNQKASAHMLRLIRSGNADQLELFFHKHPEICKDVVLEEVIEFYDRYPASTTIQKGTPLHFAIKAGSYPIVKYLLDEGANPTLLFTRTLFSQDLHGNRTVAREEVADPLALARARNHTGILEILSLRRQTARG